MDEQFYKKINIMINEAIKGYDELLEMYNEKKQALLKPDKDMLAYTDEKIIAHVKTLKDINERRENYCKNNGIEIVKMTDLIELSKKECPELEESFEEQKVKLCKILDDIRDIERKNVELLKHNLIMSDKLLDIIISAAMPQTDNYNMHGKNSKGELSISSIVEDA